MAVPRVDAPSNEEEENGNALDADDRDIDLGGSATVEASIISATLDSNASVMKISAPSRRSSTS